jgi:putative component of toxin-antitoxin plasmid stabilization module
MKIEKTKHFEKWFEKLDMSIKVRLLGYINRLADGNFSGCEPVGKAFTN